MTSHTIERPPRIPSPPGDEAAVERPAQETGLVDARRTPAPAAIEAHRLLGAGATWDLGVDVCAEPRPLRLARGDAIPPPPASRVAPGSRLSFLARRPWPSIVVAIWFILISLVAAATTRAGDGCYPIDVTWYSPTGVAGCELYGAGTASAWGGPGVARNDCTWPWTGCQAIAIRSLTTGLTVVVTPAMYCDCYTGTPDERIVDLDPASLAALGLDPGAGLWPVEIWPVDPTTGIEQQVASPAGEVAAGGGVPAVIPPAVLPDTAAAAP